MIIAWTGGHRKFAVETFFKMSEFVIATQRTFPTNAILHTNDDAHFHFSGCVNEEFSIWNSIILM